jgi:hypothetical protein
VSDGEVVGKGGEFGLSTSTTFGSCETKPHETPPSPQEPVWETIFFDGFETGFGQNFFDGGKKASITRKKKYQGKKSLLIKDDQGSSKAYTGKYDVSAYSQLKVGFRYFSAGVENNEGFRLQYASNDGSWQVAKDFVKGTDWSGNGAPWKTASVAIDPANINNIALQFKGTCNNKKDKIYFDNVQFEGLTYV